MQYGTDPQSTGVVSYLEHFKRSRSEAVRCGEWEMIRAAPRWIVVSLARQPPKFTTKFASRFQSTTRRLSRPHETRDSTLAAQARSPTQDGESDRLFPALARMVGIGCAVFVTIHTFIEYGYECAPAYGISMLPTISSFGDNLFTSKWYRRGRGVQVGDIVNYWHPVNKNTIAVKRVLGMPGDFVLQFSPGQGEGRMIQVPQGHCWVVGDDLPHSRDSRHFGPLPLALVRGKVIARLGWNQIEPNFTPVDDDASD